MTRFLAILATVTLAAIIGIGSYCALVSGMWYLFPAIMGSAYYLGGEMGRIVARS